MSVSHVLIIITSVNCVSEKEFLEVEECRDSWEIDNIVRVEQSEEKNNKEWKYEERFFVLATTEILDDSAKSEIRDFVFVVSCRQFSFKFKFIWLLYPLICILSRLVLNYLFISEHLNYYEYSSNIIID